MIIDIWYTTTSKAAQTKGVELKSCGFDFTHVAMLHCSVCSVTCGAAFLAEGEVF